MTAGHDGTVTSCAAPQTAASFPLNSVFRQSRVKLVEEVVHLQRQEVTRVNRWPSCGIGIPPQVDHAAGVAL